jgi:hypothetical protein
VLRFNEKKLVRLIAEQAFFIAKPFFLASLFPIDEKGAKNHASKKLLVSRNKLRISNHSFEASPNQRRL